jgi:hypothetical protein
MDAHDFLGEIMVNRLSIVLASGAFAGLVGCGGGGGLGSASDAFHASIQASCEKAFDCMGEYDASMHGGQAFADSYGSSVDNCVQQTNALITAFYGASFYSDLDAAVASGNITYNSDDAQVCLDAGSAESCDAFFGQNGATEDLPPECDTSFVGNVGDGDACTMGGSDFECSADGSTCDETSMTCGPG